MSDMLTLEKFEEASELVKKVTSETKLIFSEYLSGQTGNKVYLKPENMQLTGAYKLRGAYYKNKHTLAGGARERANHGIGGQSRPRCRLRRKKIWREGSDCDAHDDTAHEGEPHQKLWRRGDSERGCL